MSNGALYLAGDSLKYSSSPDQLVLPNDAWIVVEVDDIGFNIRRLQFDIVKGEYYWTSEPIDKSFESEQVIYSPTGKAFFMVFKDGMVTIGSHGEECIEPVNG